MTMALRFSLVAHELEELADFERDRGFAFSLIMPPHILAPFDLGSA
jgi:catalase